MQTKTRRQRRPNGYWEDVILPKAAEIVGSYDTPVTLRQLFYRLVSADIIDNTPAEYVQLGHRTAEARRDGWFPPLIDRTREIVVPPAWIDAEDARERMRDQFRIDRTEGQPVSIYLGIEKAGIVEQLRLWFGNRLGIPILPLGGYHSEPYEREIDTHAGGYDRPSVLLYAGDLDASGEDIERNFLRCTNFDMAKKVALTIEQADEHALPPMLGKRTDKRAAGFAAKYGSLFQIEVDALPPEVLRSLFAEAIGEHWDEDAYTAVMEREQAERRML